MRLAWPITAHDIQRWSCGEGRDSIASWSCDISVAYWLAKMSEPLLSVSVEAASRPRSGPTQVTGCLGHAPSDHEVPSPTALRARGGHPCLSMRNTAAPVVRGRSSADSCPRGCSLRVSLGQLHESLIRDWWPGRVEPPTFRFSGLRITVQDRPRRSLSLLSDVRWTPIDAGVRGCMRLQMRLAGSVRLPVGTPGCTARATALVRCPVMPFGDRVARTWRAARSWRRMACLGPWCGSSR
jgi:hypothetical protein